MNVFGQTFASQRTEDDILSHAPIKLRFGKEDYDVEPLSINKNKEWRGKVAAALNRISEGATLPMHSMDNFMASFMVMFFEFPEVVLELAMAYSDKLPRTTIKEEATDEQIVLAFSRVLAVAYPFFGLLGTMQALAKATASASTRRQ